MNSKIKSLLMPFYFGAIEENERVQVERELLADTEVLVDYLDLKRNLERAHEFNTLPSAQVWARFEERFVTKRKLVGFMLVERSH